MRSCWLQESCFCCNFSKAEMILLLVLPSCYRGPAGRFRAWQADSDRIAFWYTCGQSGDRSLSRMSVWHAYRLEGGDQCRSVGCRQTRIFLAAPSQVCLCVRGVPWNITGRGSTCTNCTDSERWQPVTATTQVTAPAEVWTSACDIRIRWRHCRWRTC